MKYETRFWSPVKVRSVTNIGRGSVRETSPDLQTLARPALRSAPQRPIGGRNLNGDNARNLGLGNMRTLRRPTRECALLSDAVSQQDRDQ